MGDREGISPTGRKRTESNGGSSDSELSEGWNIIDQTEVANPDVSSSDGESVEVIDAEDESRENVTDPEVEGYSRLAPVSGTPAVPLPEPEALAVLEESPQEEMFDSSFRWFLIYAAATVLVANIVFLVAENLPIWNADSNIEAPSFLRDWPTTPKLLSENNLIHNIPWAEKEEATVEILEDGFVTRNSERKNYIMEHSYEVKKQPSKSRGEKVDKNKKGRFTHQTNEKFYKHKIEERQKYSSYNFDDSEVGRYFETLGYFTSSFETKNKLNQVALILDALLNGLSDLEEVVAENSVLQSVLKKQKHKLSQVLTEMEYGISKSLDRLATNILNKVRKLEGRFEHQWCKLERAGHKDELKGLFYDCQKNYKKVQSEHETHSEAIKNLSDAVLKDTFKIDKKLNSYEYQVDKDSPGKEHINTHGNEIKKANGYNMVVNDFIRLQNELEILKGHLNTQEQNSPTEEGIKGVNNDRRGIFGDDNHKREFTHAKMKRYHNKRNYNDERKYDDLNRKNFDYKETLYDEQKKTNDKWKNNVDEGEGNHHNNKEKYIDDKNKYYIDKRKQCKGKHFACKEKHYEGKVKHNGDKGKNFDDKQTYYKNKKQTDESGYEDGKSTDSKRKHDVERTFSEDKSKHTARFQTFKFTDRYPNSDETNNRGQAKSDKSMLNSEPELIRRYLKESCEKGRNKVKNLYEKLKSFIDSKLRVPKKLFDSLFAKYCQVNDDSANWEKRFNRENPKGDFNRKYNKNIYKDDLELRANKNRKVRIIDISEVVPEDEMDPTIDNILIPNNHQRQWVFSHEEPLHYNKSNLTGDWFFRAGESRSRMRWSHHRGDWWFERASHRRNHPRPEWLSERRKNWYFRRARARQSCRDNPYNNWCDLSDRETVTVPNPGTNFR